MVDFDELQVPNELWHEYRDTLLQHGATVHIIRWHLGAAFNCGGPTTRDQIQWYVAEKVFTLTPFTYRQLCEDLDLVKAEHVFRMVDDYHQRYLTLSDVS